MKRNNEAGLALPTTLIVVMVLTLLGIVMFTFSMSETRQVEISENKLKAHYVARFGAHAVASYIENNPESVYGLIDTGSSKKVTSDDLDGSDFEGDFTVKVYGNPLEEVRVEATGTVEGSTQTIMVTVDNVFVDFPLFGKYLSTTGGGAGTVTGGDVFYSQTIEEEFENMIEEDYEAIYLDREFPPVVLPCEDEGSVFENNDICNDDEQDYGGETVTEDSRYGEMKAHSQPIEIEPDPEENLLLKAQKIDLHNDDMIVELGENSTENIVAVVVEEFEGGNNDIKINGKGYFMMYVKDSFETGGNFILDYDADDADETNVNIFICEDGDFEKHIAGDEDAKSKEEILEDIKTLFKLY